MTRTRARTRSIWGGLLVLPLILSSFASLLPASSVAQDAGGVAALTGTLSLDLAANKLVSMGLVDLTGFVRRDYDYAQGDSLIAGWIDHTSGDYRIDLPVAPSGPFNDVGHGGGAGPGVQIYSVDPLSSLIGDERLSPWEFAGWSWGNSSIRTVHGTHEIAGGQIAVWSPDDKEQFPTDFGADGKLFTGDDPVGPIPAGWTVVNLDQEPFVQNRSARAVVPIEPGELTPDDLSQLPPTQAFDKLVDILRARYPFADAIPVDWDKLRATYRPEFEAAEQSGEQVDFWLALNHFLIALHNWRYFAVYPYDDSFAQLVQGSTGLHADVTDDGKVIVAKVDPGQAAEQAGIRAGAELVTWDGKPARQAVDETLQFFTESSPQSVLLQKTGNFGRAPVGTTIHVEYQNPGTTELRSADLTAVEIPNEDVGRASGCYQAWKECSGPNNPPGIHWLPSHVAVVQLQFFDVDTIKAGRHLVDFWEQTLTDLSFTDARGLIVDLRDTDSEEPPGVPLYIAGSFFDEPFPLAEMTQVDAEGRTVTVGNLSVLPAPVQWDRPVAFLINEKCKGTCEFLVQALTHRPNTIIVGMSATGGSLASTTETVLLPTGNFVAVVDAAYRDPTTHDVLVEGKGIEPTLRVPKTAETIVANATTDVVLNAAEQALLAQVNAQESGAAATPSA
ncbi:MAG TPA: S41 family peptidase [Thermomicrobiales bacterium]